MDTFYRCRWMIVALACSLLHGQVPGFPIGRCVRVLGVTAPEDAAKVGFEYLELALQDLLLDEDEFAKTVERIRASRIPAVSGYGFMPADLMIVGPSVDLSKVDAALRHGLDRSKRLGLSMVVYGNLLNRARRAPEGFSPAETWKQLTEFARRAAREGGKRGITVLIEPMPPSSTNTINTVAEALRLVQEVNDPHFRMLVDFGYFTTSHEDIATLTRAAGYIKQVEIQNPNGRVYPRSSDEADYASFFRALKSGGYRGGFSIHGAPKDVFADAPVAIAMLRKVLLQVDRN